MFLLSTFLSQRKVEIDNIKPYFLTMKCIFCDIVNHKAHAEVLYDNENVLSFLDINPVNFGHTLVITKKHYEDFLSVPKDELDHVIRAVQEISEVIQNKLTCDGFNIVINNGSAAGQTVA